MTLKIIIRAESEQKKKKLLSKFLRKGYVVAVVGKKDLQKPLIKKAHVVIVEANDGERR